ncbi:hypothetical protein Anapl_09469 [Anas platyrhynchos]|uniref:Uncharacterized protein n=1 Tax=Anas platyrhynchos TaxID=8839 RepID=R0JZ44_ANAPL|nr:hypothetical protein Anapl_09469 [Anas platyrhynchos]
MFLRYGAAAGSGELATSQAAVIQGDKAKPRVTQRTCPAWKTSCDVLKELRGATGLTCFVNTGQHPLLLPSATRQVPQRLQDRRATAIPAGINWSCSGNNLLSASLQMWRLEHSHIKIMFLNLNILVPFDVSITPELGFRDQSMKDSAQAAFPGPPSDAFPDPAYSCEASTSPNPQKHKHLQVPVLQFKDRAQLLPALTLPSSNTDTVLVPKGLLPPGWLQRPLQWLTCAAEGADTAPGQPPTSSVRPCCPDSLGARTCPHPLRRRGSSQSLSNKPRKSKLLMSGTKGLTYLRY